MRALLVTMLIGDWAFPPQVGATSCHFKGPIREIWKDLYRFGNVKQRKLQELYVTALFFKVQAVKMH